MIKDNGDGGTVSFPVVAVGVVVELGAGEAVRGDNEVGEELFTSRLEELIGGVSVFSLSGESEELVEAELGGVGAGNEYALSRRTRNCGSVVVDMFDFRCLILSSAINKSDGLSWGREPRAGRNLGKKAKTCVDG